MSLFNQILSAIDNPDQEGSADQLSTIVNTVQQLSGNYQTDPSAVQSAMSTVGNYVRGALVEKRNTEGEGAVQDIVNQFGGTQPSNQVLNMLFSAPQLQEMIQKVAGTTGLSPQLIQSMLPSLVPLVLNFLKTGNQSQNPLRGNSVVNSFLDNDGDGDVDLGDALSMASRYLNR